jgi:hypothetical protein
MYIYENHMGGFYTTDEMLDDDSLYCETCGDHDWLLGQADTKEEFLGLIDPEEWSEEYIETFISEHFE